MEYWLPFRLLSWLQPFRDFALFLLIVGPCAGYWIYIIVNDENFSWREFALLYAAVAAIIAIFMIEHFKARL